MPYGGNFSWGNTLRRSSYYFTGSQNSASKLSWNDIDIAQNFRSITPKNRTGENGIGAYSQDTMMNFTYFLGSNGRIGGEWFLHANNGSASLKQVTNLTSIKPNIAWNAHWYHYEATDSATFNETNASDGNWKYNFYRLSQGNIVHDIVNGLKATTIIYNNSSNWDDRLFTISGGGQPAGSHGNKFNKVTISTNLEDFSVSRPLIYQDVGGLPRAGDNVYSKEAAVDGAYQAGDHDYYLNYYPKYNSSLTNIPRSKSGYDWGAINSTSGGAGLTGYRGYSTGFNKHI